MVTDDVEGAEFNQSASEVPEQILDFRIDIFKIHVSVVQDYQKKQFEILKYSPVILFLYYGFFLGAEGANFLSAPRENMIEGHEILVRTIFAVPVVLIGFLFLYERIIDRKIQKHGKFLGYMHDQNAFGQKYSTNYFLDFQNKHKNDPEIKMAERIFDKYWVFFYFIFLGTGSMVMLIGSWNM